MISYDEAKSKIIESIKDSFKPYDDAILLEKYILSKKYGWIFTYNNKKYIENPIIENMFVGHGPIIVLKRTGQVIHFGSYFSPESLANYIENELKIWLLIVHNFSSVPIQFLKLIKQDFGIEMPELIEMRKIDVCKIESDEISLTKLKSELEKLNISSDLIFQDEKIDGIVLK